MVLQSGRRGRIFGFSPEPASEIIIEFENGQGKSEVYSGCSDDNCCFEIWFGAHGCGGPYRLTVRDNLGNSVAFDNVLFGEVFLLGGQSNMGWALNQCYDGSVKNLLYKEEIASSANDSIRCMLVWPEASKEPVDFLESTRSWEAAKPETVPFWSACGYFFGKRLNELLNVPVGLIHACMGGTPIEAWQTEGEWYKGVVNPVKKLALRGVCWYQGEGDPAGYGERLERLIMSWRREFENPELFWAAVSLPRHIDEEKWFLSRRETEKLYGRVENYTYCVTVDTGLYPEWTAEGDTLNGDGIHPYDKESVGRRLAEAVAADLYKLPGIYKAPKLRKTDYNADIGEIKLTFENCGSGLIMKGDRGFEVDFGEGFVPCVPVFVSENGPIENAPIENASIGNAPIKNAPMENALIKNTLIIKVNGDKPAAVRYGYKNFRGPEAKSPADSVCVYSKEGIPAEDFLIKL